MYLKGAMVAVHDVVGVAPPPQGLTRESVSIAQQHVQQEQPVPRITCIMNPFRVFQQTRHGEVLSLKLLYTCLCDSGPGFLRACKASKGSGSCCSQQAFKHLLLNSCFVFA